MKKKFIQKSDLGEIMEYLSERALKNADKVSLDMRIVSFAGEMQFSATLRDYHTFAVLAKQSYIIIDKLSDDLDISEEIFDAGLAEKEKQAARLKELEEKKESQEEVPQVNSEDND